MRTTIPGIGVQATDPSATDAMRLTVTLDGCRIKIDVSPVARGAVWPTEMREVVATVEERLGYSENRLLSFNDLYAGKMRSVSPGSIRAICSISRCCWTRKASAGTCSRPFSCT